MMATPKRIKLRHKTISDARDDYAWQIDEELAQLDAAIPLAMSYQQFLSEYSFELCYPNSNRHEFGVDTLDGKHIGNCVYYNMNQAERKTEIGIMIGDREYWNKGYGTEVINALLERLFETTNLDRIYLNTLAWNLRAQKCFKKCGFVETGRVERDGSEFLIMLLNRQEWEAQTAAFAPQA